MDECIQNIHESQNLQWFSKISCIGYCWSYHGNINKSSIPINELETNNYVQCIKQRV